MSIVPHTNQQRETMNTNTTHPALDAHNAGRSRRFDSGRDWTSYVVVIDGLPWLVTIWDDGRTVTLAA